MNRYDELKKSIKQKIKALERNKSERKVFIILAVLSLMVLFCIFITCFLADDITITDILSIFLSLVGFLISYTTYFAGERENRDFQIDFYNFMLQLLDEIIAEGQWVFLIREPTINLASIEVCRIRRYKFDDDTISLPQEPLPGFNADFDGDQLNLCFLIDENIHKEFEPFHLSCMTNFITEKFTIELMNWSDVSLGLMSL